MSAQNKNLHISISGLIGAGKTKLSESLAKELGYEVYYEPVADNEYLEDFYADQKKYAFPFQIYLLNKRFAQHQKIIWSGNGAVSDRTLHEDAIFAQMLFEDGKIDERDFRTYQELSQNLQNFMRQPSVIVHLDVSPEKSLERIKKRSRDCESTIPLAYLQKLAAGYETFLSEISRTVPVIRVDWSEFKDVKEVAAKIVGELQKMHNLRFIK